MWYLLVIALCLVLIIFVLIPYKNRNGLCILMYHHIGPITDINESRFFINGEMFLQQLDLLINKGFHPVSLSEVEAAFEHKQKLPKYSIMITLDDGWLDNYTIAFPIIREKKIPVTIFLSTALIGVDKDLLDWEQVQEMYESRLVQFASHGAHHKRLRSLSDQEALEELSISKALLEEKLNLSVKSFCYPYGAVDSRIRKLVFKAGYTMDYGTRKGINSWPWRGNRPLLRAHIMAGESLNNYHIQLATGYKTGVFFIKK